MKTEDSMVNAYRPGAEELASADAALIARRGAALGPAYRLFYERPFHPVRGRGVWLYDKADAAYLDVYNNVACVGHCHPAVVAAMADQAGRLATHTRYLQDGVLDYAERLLSHFPPAFHPGAGHVMFTCTGSEANDLALRLAFARSGGTGVIVTENAYHGVTLAVAGISPSLGRGAALGPHVVCVPAPFGPGAGAGFAAAVEAAIADLATRGIRPAALIVDTVFSSDGVVTGPGDLLSGAAAAIRAAGGLFIADEVQAGFGRTGEAMWGFQRHGALPDMVSLGKPMGNGYPVAGLVMQAGMVADFGARSRYFNTFGGNAVATATAMAVLRVIEDEGLVQNALQVGAVFRDGLRALARDHASLGEVRAAGLCLGVDVLDGAGRPDAERAARIVNGLREARVLISATGMQGHVLKLRPPLVFGKDHVARVLERLDTVLRALP